MCQGSRQHNKALQLITLHCRVWTCLAFLQNVAQHFTMSAWVQGPARTCQLLRHLKLPRVHVSFSSASQVHPLSQGYSLSSLPMLPDASLRSKQFSHLQQGLPAS